jgi:thiol-disulfide isomerase/thioredoxin
MKSKLWLYVLVLVLGLGGIQIAKVLQEQPSSSSSVSVSTKPSPMAVSNEAFAVQYGIDKPSPEALKKLTVAGKPLFIEFRSQLCKDCQKMAPTLSHLMPRFPGVSAQVLDVLDDRKKAPEIFRAFNPSTVPVLVFITSKGEIQTVLNGYQTEATLSQAFSDLEKQVL